MILLLNSALHAAEAGRLPDSAVRFGIRRLLRQRLASLNDVSCEQQQERFRQFLAEASSGPVAPVPEKANEQHYEVPPEFFRVSLGPRLKYSSCYWPDGVSTLAAAEDAALKATCERADLQDGMSVLELGCGWGSLSLWMAEKYPGSQITAVSNSNGQRQFIQDRAAERGLNNLQVITADMNDFATDCDAFDRVVSVEMFEHMRNHAELLRRISTWLKPGGRLFVHIFCHKQHAYPFETDGAANWMGRHFFTGGIMPSESLLKHYQQDLTLVDQWRWNGQHYEKTCNAWLELMDQHRATIEPLFAEAYGNAATRWIGRWRIFYMACAELFGWDNGNEWWVSHYLFEKTS